MELWKMENKNAWNVRLYKNVEGTMHVNGKNVKYVDLPISDKLCHFFRFIENFGEHKWSKESKLENLQSEFDRYLCALYELDHLDLELLWYLKNMPISFGLRNRIRKEVKALYEAEYELTHLEEIFPEKMFHSCTLEE